MTLEIWKLISLYHASSLYVVKHITTSLGQCPLYTRNRARFSRFLQTLCLGPLRRVILFLAAPRRDSAGSGRY